MNFTYVIKRPIISEKSTLQTEAYNTYLFEVAVNANKQQIKQAVEKLFNVKVLGVNTSVAHGKVKRTAKSVTKRANWKKALVTLKEGNKIEFFQGV